MERLTMEYCGEYVPKELCSIDRSGNADDCDLCCEYCKTTEDGADCRGCAINQCFNKLGEYEKLEDNDKLLKLPCAVGDVVYAFNMAEIIELKVIELSWFSIDRKSVVNVKCLNTDLDCFRNFIKEEFGNTVFLTREEAEAALKELRNV